MDVIHANASRMELGYIKYVTQLDAEISQAQGAALNENSWQIILDDDTWADDPILWRHYIYAIGTEFGGPVEYIKHSTASKQITLSGPTWRGMLMRKVIEPPPGQAYLTVSAMEANAAVALLVGSMFGSVIGVSTDDTNVDVSASFRYDNMLYGIEAMLAGAGLALAISYDQTARKAILSARPINDLSNVIDLSQDYGVNMTSAEGRIDGYNHVVGLGAGELLDRDIVNRYRLDDGTITGAPPEWAGTDLDVVAVLDYTSAESADKVIESADKKLLEYAPRTGIEMDPVDIDLLLGDVVGARDRLTGMQVSATVIGKILKITESGVSIQTKVG